MWLQCRGIGCIAHAVVIEAIDSFDERFEKKQNAMSLEEGGKSCRNI